MDAALRSQVYRSVRSIVKDPVLADDITQNTLIRLLKKAHTYDGKRGTYSSWVYMNARCESLDTLRRSNTVYRRTAGVNELDHLAGDDCPEDCLDQKQQVDLVKTYISTMPEKDRDILHRYFIDNDTTDAIASDYGITKGLVWVWINRAKTKLRNGLEEACSR